MPERRQHTGPTVRKEIRIRATPDEVWSAWADPERIAHWFVDRAEGHMGRDAVVTWIFEAFGYRLPIQVFEAEPGRYLAFGGEEPGRPLRLQEVHVVGEGGTTLLRLANSGFGGEEGWEEEYAGVDSGWELALATLRHWLERHGGRGRVHRIAMGPAALEYERALGLYATRAGLEAWLARAAQLEHDPLRRGSRARLELREGGVLDGEVLAISGREVLLSWPERDGQLALKAFGAGPGQRVAALAFDAWPRDPARVAGVEALLQAALGRLVPALEAREGPGPVG